MYKHEIRDSRVLKLPPSGSRDFIKDMQDKLSKTEAKDDFCSTR